MYFLNGDRIYINPKNSCKTLDEQLHNCLLQLTKINSGKKIFKLNFFVDTVSNYTYLQLQQKIQAEVDIIFSDQILLSVIAQPPLTCKIIIEACFYDPSVWQTTPVLDGNNGAVLFQNENSKVLIGSVQSFSNQSCKENSEQVFDGLLHVFNLARFPLNTIVRQWNYIEDILGFDGQEQRYQAFNNARSKIYGDWFEEEGYPAATGIGTNSGGIIIEFLAVQSPYLKSLPINNPSQIAAHNYSKKVLEGEECVLKTTPKFERARYLELFGKKLIFISGTASIIGERTVGVGDPAEQTEITIQNIKQLYSAEILYNLSAGSLNPKYGHARVYVKNRKDFPIIKRTFKSHFGNLPVVYIIADICRNDLLVEIEGKVILE
jgi:enamine deaminase RidA (YjgF/YER057c/UK114 family)